MKYYTFIEVGEIFGTHPDTIRRWVKTGKLKALALPGQYRISQEDLDAFIKSRETKIKGT